MIKTIINQLNCPVLPMKFKKYLKKIQILKKKTIFKNKLKIIICLTYVTLRKIMGFFKKCQPIQFSRFASYS